MDLKVVAEIVEEEGKKCATMQVFARGLIEKPDAKTLERQQKEISQKINPIFFTLLRTVGKVKIL